MCEDTPFFVPTVLLRGNLKELIVELLLDPKALMEHVSVVVVVAVVRVKNTKYIT